MAPLFTFKSEERLKSRKDIARLFDEGQSNFAFPLKILYTVDTVQEPLCFPVQMAVAIPKRKIKSAVKRNLLKRRCKEAYRILKPALYSSLKDKPLKINLMFVYMTPELKNYSVIESSIKKLLNALKADLNS